MSREEVEEVVQNVEAESASEKYGIAAEMIKCLVGVIIDYIQGNAGKSNT